MRRPGRRHPATSDRGGADADDTQQYRTAWGLDPAQWRPVGRLATVRERALFAWRIDGAEARDDVALRARRAYDRLGELGVTVAADATPKRIEVTLPLARVDMALRALGEWAILPDAVAVTDLPAERLRELRREIAAWRGRVALEVGGYHESDPVAELRARVQLRD